MCRKSIVGAYLETFVYFWSLWFCFLLYVLTRILQSIHRLRILSEYTVPDLKQLDTQNFEPRTVAMFVSGD
jgi:hypothetical protein